MTNGEMTSYHTDGITSNNNDTTRPIHQLSTSRETLSQSSAATGFSHSHDHNLTHLMYLLADKVDGQSGQSFRSAKQRLNCTKKPQSHESDKLIDLETNYSCFCDQFSWLSVLRISLVTTYENFQNCKCNSYIYYAIQLQLINVSTRSI